MTKTLTWDASINLEEKKEIKFKPGDSQRFIVKSSQFKVSKAGNEMIEISFTVTDKSGNTLDVRDWILTSSESAL